MPRKPSKPDDPGQYKRFLEAARKAKADETKRGADRAFKKVVSAKQPVTKKTRPLIRNFYPRKFAFIRKVIYEWFLRRLYSAEDLCISPYEIVQLIPYWRTRTRKIETTAIVLFYGGNLRQASMKLAVVAKDNPAFLGDSR